MTKWLAVLVGLAAAPPARAGDTVAFATVARPAETVVFTGMCDASAAVALDAHTFAVADDEDNILRVYDARTGGAPLRLIDLSPMLPLRAPDELRIKPPRPGKKPRETDLEAGTTLGGAAYWLTSHGRTSKGKLQTARLMFFATTLPRPGQPVRLEGQPYRLLLDDLLAAEPLRRFDLAAASQRAPKEPGGLNIEGLTTMPGERAMYIGFRNPVPGGRALLVPLLNPREMMDGARARLGEPVLLDLGGQGVRALSWWRGRYLVVAGDPGEGGTSHLYTWDGRDRPRPVDTADLAGLHAEAVLAPDDRDQILVLSDDGSVPVGPFRCKDLPDPAQKHFRGLRLHLRLPSAPAARR